MRRILSPLAFTLVFVASCIGFAGDAHAASSVSFLQFTSDATALSTHTFSAQNLGTPASDRYIFVIVHGEEKATPISSVTVTIGGVSATTDVFVDDAGNGDIAAIARARVPIGTTGDIVVTTNDSTGIGIGVYRASGIGTPVLKQTTTDLDDVINFSIDTAVGGLVFAGASYQSDGFSVTTSGVTENYDSDIGVGTDRSVGGFAYPATSTSPLSISFDSASSGNAGGVAASYQIRPAVSKPPNNLGLVGYWPMDEATSTIAGDFSGNRNNGTMNTFASPPTSSSGWTNGKRGGALRFDGTSDYVLVTDPGANSVFDFTTGQTITISAWLKANADYGTAFASVVHKAFGSGDVNWYLQLPSGQIQAGYGDGADASFESYRTTNTLPTGGWHHVVATWTFGTASSMNIYLDGALQSGSWTSGTGNVAPDVNNNAVAIGDDGFSEQYGGVIDELRIYNRGLSATEVAALYAGGTAGATRGNASSRTLAQGTTLNTGLVGHWTMDGRDVRWLSGTDANINDVSPSGNVVQLCCNITTGQLTSIGIGKIGQAMNFDGVDDYLGCNDSACGPTLDMGTSNWTVTAWVKPDTVTNNGHVVTKQDFFGGGNPAGWYLNVNGSGRVASGLRDVNTNEVQSTNDGTVMTAGVWQHIAVTFNRSGNMIRYLNGAQTGSADSITTASASVDNTNKFRIGARDAVGDEFPFDGAIDDVRVYNRVLSPAEIKQLYLLGGSVIKP